MRGTRSRTQRAPRAEAGGSGAGRSCGSRRLIVAVPSDGKSLGGGWTKRQRAVPGASRGRRYEQLFRPERGLSCSIHPDSRSRSCP
jgi:hypothetical protein